MKEKALKASNSGDVRQRISETLRNKWKDPEFRVNMLEKIKSRKSQAGTITDASHRQKISEAMKAKWRDPSYRQSAIEGMARKRGLSVVDFISSRPQRKIRSTTNRTGISSSSNISSKQSASPATRRARSIMDLQCTGVSVVRAVTPMVSKRRTNSVKGIAETSDSESTRNAVKTVKVMQATASVTLPKKKAAKKTKKAAKVTRIPPSSSALNIDAPAMPSTTRVASVDSEEERKARMREENRKLYDLLYGDDYEEGFDFHAEVS